MKSETKKNTSTRERVERNIYRDKKTGHLLVVKYCGYNDKGAQRTTVTCYTLKEARDERDKHEYERKKHGKASSNTQITVSECIEQYIDEKPLQETTKDGYRIRLNRIKKYPLGKTKIVSVKKIDIDRYLDGLQKETPLKNKTINGDRQLLQAVFNYAMECEYINNNVTLGVKKKSEDKFEAKTLTKEEVDIFLSKLDECKDIRLKTVLCLGAIQGLRRGEISAVRWEDIIETPSGMRLKTIKSRTAVKGGIIEKSTKSVSSCRSNPLFPIVQKTLEEYRTYQTEMGTLGEYVVIANKGTPIHPSQINNMFSAFMERAGLKHIRVHDLRHTCCTLFMENGAKLSTVLKFLGHSSLQVTERIYTHLHDNITDELCSICTDLFGV